MDSSLALRPCAETPYMSDRQIELVNQIDNGESYKEIYWTILRMAGDLRALGEPVVQFNPEDIYEAFHDYTSRKEMLLLLHSIPRPVLRSIVMRTVAYDFWERDSENRKLLYDAEGPGAYIASISVVGRKGQGWTERENSGIVDSLKQYARAIDLKEKDEDHYSDSQYLLEDRAALLVSVNIDKEYRRQQREDDGEDPEDSEEDPESQDRDFPMPRFASSSRQNKSRHVKQLIQLLEKRNANLPWNDQTMSKQSFCMVGNSDDVEKRKQNHRLIGSLTNTAHLWGLLVSCLKYHELQVQDTIIPACKAWNFEQINMAEILLTVLSGSLVSVGGLNVKQPGTKSMKNPPSALAFEGCKLHVWKAKPWFLENLEHSYPHMKGFIDARSELEASSTADLERLGTAVQRARTDRDKALEDMDDVVEQLRQLEKEQLKAESHLHSEEENDELIGFLALEDPVDEDTSARPSPPIPYRTRHASV